MPSIVIFILSVLAFREFVIYYGRAVALAQETGQKYDLNLR